MFSETAWPSADEAARAILATLMADPNADVMVDGLVADDFHAATTSGAYWAGIFEAIKSLIDEGRRAAPFMVEQQMRKLGQIPPDHSTSEVMANLNQMAQSYATGATITDYVQVLRTYGVRRRIRLAGHMLVDLANNDKFGTAEYLAQMEATVAEVNLASAQEELLPRAEAVRDALQTLREQKRGEFPGLRTGFGSLDVMLRGLRSSELIILAARPSMGKSALAQDIANNVALAGKVAIYVSREMSSSQLAERDIASIGGVSAGDIRGALLNKERIDQAEATMAHKGLFSSSLYLDRRSRTVPEIRTQATRTKRKKGLDLIIIDYLQLLSGTGKYGKQGNRVTEIGEISRSLKEMATSLEVPVLALSQLSRASETRGKDERRPVLSDLRDSGDIEQDGDIVAFLYRDSYYAPKDEQPKVDIAEVIIAKNRNGPLGTAKLQFIPERVTFVNIDYRHG